MRKVQFTVFKGTPNPITLNGFFTERRARTPMHLSRKMRPPKYYYVEVYKEDQNSLPAEYEVGDPSEYIVAFRDLTFVGEFKR